MKETNCWSKSQEENNQDLRLQENIWESEIKEDLEEDDMKKEWESQEKEMEEAIIDSKTKETTDEVLQEDNSIDPLELSIIEMMVE
jgi:hypothetical protein